MVSLFKVLSLRKQKHLPDSSQLYRLDSSLGTEEQAYSLSASEKLTSGCCKTSICSENPQDSNSSPGRERRELLMGLTST